MHAAVVAITRRITMSLTAYLALLFKVNRPLNHMRLNTNMNTEPNTMRLQYTIYQRVSIVDLSASNSGVYVLRCLCLFVNATSVAARPIWKNARINTTPIRIYALGGKCSVQTYLANIEVVIHIEMIKLEIKQSTCCAMSSFAPTSRSIVTMIVSEIDHTIT